GELSQEVPQEHRGFAYVLKGSAEIGGRRAREGEVAWFEPGPGDTLQLVADETFRAVLFSSPPIEEPVVAYGPFVMNAPEEIRQAFLDYQAGRLVAPEG